VSGFLTAEQHNLYKGSFLETGANANLFFRFCRRLILCRKQQKQKYWLWRAYGCRFLNYGPFCVWAFWGLITLHSPLISEWRKQLLAVKTCGL